MNYPSNPNPSSTDFTEFFKFDDFDDTFHMIMEEIGREDHQSSSPTLSWTSSEKLVAAEITSPLQINQATSPMSLEIGDKDETKKRKRHKDDPILHVFKTKSVDQKVALDDGYKWRKYGKKPITGSPFPRHYHKCSNPDCNVKKKIERDTNNPDYVLTTYEGRHNHPSPSVVYCDSDDFDLTSLNNWSFQTTNTYSFSHSAPY
ncbi:WRKY transcription factor 59 [Arabidopsis lyrata subsp. lyrata]|uniref:WRKY transcription factor 59 n=1 Tax=Arabidopsis lyrata subsp. lyrata TaxID=81972 RepID=D7LCL4_ARALL|nr:probable WRKY transcription factor 59 [Arabidopsis lyrata subsp. lyrata]EFH56663.1 WRKY transcription factor 59 [Arabidopsis lyrata subsp. lyrata]|eukprot:XP_002880404.1 probable WRKY transcription factor 59 [Arabidopsis lyrata subsp. lyrata]